jgi:MFS transporter, Spinster family, sphingosine-1-phosphate transporter
MSQETGGLSSQQRMMLFTLMAINFFNYLDRQVVFPMFGYIKEEFQLSDLELGLLGTAFLLTHSLASLPLGFLADRYSRKAIISLSVFVWSFASFFSGLARTFHQLLFARSVVGLGEAGYAPAASAMITDNFAQDFRGQAQGIFNIGMLLGGTLGAMLGGLIAHYLSWRLAFFIVSVPGLFLAYLVTRLDDRRPEHDDASQVSTWVLFRNPAYLWMIMSGILTSFAAGGLIAWGVEFLSRYKGYNIRDASLFLGSIYLVAGVSGVIVGSWLADRLHRSTRLGRSLLISISLVVSFPFVYLGLQDIGQGHLFLVLFFVGIFLTSFYHGPQIVVMHDIVPKRLRASSVAIYFLIVHLLGDTTAPAVVGMISDEYDLKSGLELATSGILLAGLSYLPVCYLIAKERVTVHED